MASAVVVKGAPMASLLKELPAAPSAFEKPVASASALGVEEADDTSEKPSGKDTVDGRLALDLSVPKFVPTGTATASCWPFPSLPLVFPSLTWRSETEY